MAYQQHGYDQHQGYGQQQYQQPYQQQQPYGQQQGMMKYLRLSEHWTNVSRLWTTFLSTTSSSSPDRTSTSTDRLRVFPRRQLQHYPPRHELRPEHRSPAGWLRTLQIGRDGAHGRHCPTRRQDQILNEEILHRRGDVRIDVHRLWQSRPGS